MVRGLFIAGLALIGALSVGPVPSTFLSRSPRLDAPTAPARTSIDLPPEAFRSDDTPAVVPARVSRRETPRPTLTLKASDRELQRRLGPFLPEHMSVPQAARGFSDERQFATAVHVAHNLGIPFTQMKAKVVEEGLSVGQAIQVLSPESDVWEELMRARSVMARQER